MTIETVATDTRSRGIAAILVTCEVDGVKRPVSCAYPDLRRLRIAALTITWHEEPAHDLVRRILLIIPEGLRDELLDIPDEVLTEIDRRRLDVAHVGVTRVRALTCIEDRLEAIDRLVVATYRVTSDSSEGIVTEEQGGRYVLITIGVGDGALTTDVLQLASLNGGEATAGEDRATIRDSRRRRAAISPVGVEDPIGTSETRERHRVVVRDVVVRPFDLDRCDLARTLRIGAVDVASKIIERDQADVIIVLLLEVREEVEARTRLLLAIRSLIGQRTARHVAQLDIGLFIELTVHVVSLTTCQIEVATHDRHERHIRLGDRLTRFVSTNSIDMRHSIARGGLRIQGDRGLGMIDGVAWARGGSTIIVAEALTRDST